MKPSLTLISYFTRYPTTSHPLLGSTLFFGNALSFLVAFSCFRFPPFLGVRSWNHSWRRNAISRLILKTSEPYTLPSSCIIIVSRSASRGLSGGSSFGSERSATLYLCDYFQSGAVLRRGNLIDFIRFQEMLKDEYLIVFGCKNRLRYRREQAI